MVSPEKIHIHNTFTNIVGRTKTERIVSGEIWHSEILPALEPLISSSPFYHQALIGRWVVSAKGNDPHMHEFFVRNWKAAEAAAQPEIRCYIFTGVREKERMMKLLGLKSEADLLKHRDSFLEALQDKKFRSSLKDPKLAGFEKLSSCEQLDEALFSPATIYCPDEFIFVTLNTNYYGQLKSKSSLGPLEEKLIRRARLDGSGEITNPEEVWLSMHAGSLQYVTEKKLERGIVMIAPTGTGKSTHGYGLVNAKKENRLHSDDWVFVNVGTREVIVSENHYYMRTNIAGLFPHLIPILVVQPLENVAFTPEMVELLESFDSSEDLARAVQDGRFSKTDYKKLIEQMVENNSARSLIDPRKMVGPGKFVESTVMTDLFLMKRDYDSPLFLKQIGADEMIAIMTSKNNVYNYVYGKEDVDGYGIPASRTTEIYYNPYLCQCRVDHDNKIVGDYDKIRIEAYRQLIRHDRVKAAWINTRLPANQTQFCLRKYLEEEAIDEIRVEKETMDPGLLSILQLQLKDKPPVDGRRPMDLKGFFNGEGLEAECIAFYSKGKLLETVALAKHIQNGKATEAACEFLGAARIKNGKPVFMTKGDFIFSHQAIGVTEILRLS